MSAETKTDLCFQTIDELAPRLHSGELSPVAVTEAVLERVARYNETMRVYITVTAELALEQARQAEHELRDGIDRGPLHGIPVSLKDNIATAGIRTSCASQVNPDWVPDEDATVYAKLRQAGAVLIGKANLFEYAFSMNPDFPQPLNPWNPAKTSSGSSSGSAVSVATGMAYGSLGSDTGGSGRAPANVNGVVGLKATYGRVSRAGVVPLSYSLDHVTVMARGVRDSAHVLQAIAGADPRDPSAATLSVPDFGAQISRPIAGLRLARARGYTHEGLDPEVERVVEEAIAVLVGLGATVSDHELPMVRESFPLQQAILLPEAAVYHYETLRAVPERLGESALMRLDLGNTIPATAYIQAQQARGRLRDEFRTLFGRFDAIVGPALAMRAGEAGTWTTTIAGKAVDLRVAGPEYTGIYNLAGIPALVLPGGFSRDGMPVGFQIAGPWWDEATVLRIAAAFEQATDFHRRRPPYPV